MYMVIKLNLSYYFHYPFTANHEKWKKSFIIDDNIEYDYLQFNLDIFTFCGCN